MILQSEQPGMPRRGVRRGGTVGELIAGYGQRSVTDLMGQSGVSRGISEMLFPEVEELPVVCGAVSRDARAGEARAAGGPDTGMDWDLRLAAAREEAYALARGDAEAELQARLAEERRRVDRMRVEFARDRQRFFAAAESQVVRLALAVASRILAREIATDGMHLRSTVKAALARVQDNSTTALRVPEAEAGAWTALFERGLTGRVKVIGDERMQKGDCVLETTVGRVELGVEVQLNEVGRTFGELLQDVDGGDTTNDVENISSVQGDRERNGPR